VIGEKEEEEEEEEEEMATFKFMCYKILKRQSK